MGPNQTDKLLHSKGNRKKKKIEKKKTTYRREYLQTMQPIRA